MRFAVITTGGDAPGMNAAIRSVVRTAVYYNHEVTGIRRGWWGLIEGDFLPMQSKSVSNIISQGGTILHTLRCPDFKIHSVRKKAAAKLSAIAPDGLIVIGGDGSMRAAYELSKMSKVSVVGIPASIDNDIAGTEETIGFDTAINTALYAIDKIRDTAFSHQRAFIVEVMGRSRGFLAAAVGIGSGAEIILVPENKYKKTDMVSSINRCIKKGKSSIIIVMAEGAGNSDQLAAYLQEKLKIKVRISKLGYIQRGGSPTADSRMMASVFGKNAVDLLISKKGERITKMLAWKNNLPSEIELSYPFRNTKPMDDMLLKTAEVLAG